MQLREHGGERGDAGRAVVVGGVLGGRVRDPGRVAHEQHRGGHVRRRARRRRGRRRWAAAGRRRAARRGGPRSAVSKDTSAVTDSAVERRPSCRPGRRGRSPCARSPATSASSVAASAARASSQPVTRDGIALVAFGLDRDPADGGVRAAQPGLLVGGEHREGERQHRVAAVGHQRGAGVVALAARSRSASGRAARSRWRRRPGASSARPCSTCSSTNAPNRPSRSGRCAGRRAAERLGEASPRRGRAAPPPGGRVDRAGEQPGTQAGQAEAGALLLGEGRDHDRPAGATPAARSSSTARNALTIPSGPS